MRIAAMTILLWAGSCMAFADEPVPVTAAPAAAAAAPATPAATTVTTTTVTTTTTTPAADAAQSEIEAKKAAAAERIKKSGLGGYKPEVHGGNTVYCKVEQQIGSRFSTKQCRSYEQLMADQQAGKDYTDQLQKMGVQPRQ
jgi:hypothetical protein